MCTISNRNNNIQHILTFIQHILYEIVSLGRLVRFECAFSYINLMSVLRLKHCFRTFLGNLRNFIEAEAAISFLMCKWTRFRLNSTGIPFTIIATVLQYCIR